MSKFSKALEQAQRERAFRMQVATAAPAAAPAPAPAPPPTITPPRRGVVLPRRAAAISGEVDGHLVSLVAPASLEAEQYRALRHLVEQRQKAENLSVIAVSGPGVGDGKTTTAVNLAGALAQGSDASVLLVEADFRRPSIGQALGFNDSNSVGLVDAILDRSLGLVDIAQPRPPFNLSVVLAGQTPPSPYELLKSSRLGALLDEARERYNYVVMDTPPLVAVQDCRVVARWVDGIIVVVAAHHTPRALLEAALDVLDPTKVLGIVFNGYDDLLSGRYASHYAGYYASAAGTPGPTASRLRQAGKKVGSLLRRHVAGGGKGRRRSRERSR